MYHAVYLLIVVSPAFGQIIEQGVCNYANIGGYVSNINVTRMLGTWNQIARIENTQEVGECSSLSIEGNYGANGTLIGAYASHVEVFNETKGIHKGTLQPVSTVIDGFFLMNLTGFYTGVFVVQATNYVDYAIFYSCRTIMAANVTANTTGTKAVLAWQYHRKATPSSSELVSILKMAGVNPDLSGVAWKYVSHNKTACGNGGVSLAVPHVLIILATLFKSKDFV